VAPPGQDVHYFACRQHVARTFYSGSSKSSGRLAGPVHTYSGPWGKKAKKGLIDKKKVQNSFISKATQYIAYIDGL
jgi:hypothetical protein